jgi:DNA-binding GntR family transcriptional regulator
MNSNAGRDESSPVAGIVDWVARGIIEGRLLAGNDLNSVDLAKRFEVRRTPVREALFVLRREGLVDCRRAGVRASLRSS